MKRQTFNEINITPLTDIFLVLLIIMMVVAPILDQQGLKLTIPDYVEESAIQNKEQKIYICPFVICFHDKFFFWCVISTNI